jgi:hypothetical protein
MRALRPERPIQTAQAEGLGFKGSRLPTGLKGRFIEGDVKMNGPFRAGVSSAIKTLGFALG